MTGIDVVDQENATGKLVKLYNKLIWFGKNETEIG